MPRVLIAPDKFKGSLTAADVATSVGEGIRLRCRDAEVVAAPVADGGDGTVAAAVAAGFAAVPVTATGPTGEPVDTCYARRGEVAVVEMADVSGLVRLPHGRLDALRATSRGTGEVLAAAVDAGCRRVVLGIGGSASTDGGAGMVAALGARLLDRHGEEIADGGGALADLASVDLSGVRARMEGVHVTVACDVDNPLTGPNGAAVVYGPQKGATPEQVDDLDRTLAHWAGVVLSNAADASAGMAASGHAEAPGAGAAGGVGFAAIALLGADLRPGIDLVLDLVGFHEGLASANLVVTGEGAVDEQTLRGKAPAGVAAAASRHGVPVVAVCGHRSLDSQTLRRAGIIAAYALTDLEPDVQRCIDHPGPLLRRIAQRIAEEHLNTQA